MISSSSTNKFVKSERKCIIMFGQSNCAGNEPIANLQVGYQNNYSTIHKWNGATLSNLDYSTQANFGCEFSLMTRMQAFYGTDVYFSRGAWGACGLALGAGTAGDLTPSSPTSHYHEATAFWNSLLSQFALTQNSIKAAVLILGESDASSSTYANAYNANLTAAILNIRSNLNIPTLPIIISTLNIGIDTVQCPQFATINTAIASVVSAGTNVFSVNTDSLTFSSGNLHYNAAGYDGLGLLFYNSMIANNLLT